MQLVVHFQNYMIPVSRKSTDLLDPITA